MKKLISLIAVVGIIFSSCNGNYTIAKRKYTKGFYVSKGSNKHSQPGIAPAKAVKANAPEEKVATEIVKTKPVQVQGSMQEPEMTVSVKKMAEPTKNKPVPAHQKAAEKPALVSNHNNYTPQKVSFKEIVVAKEKIKDNNTKGGDSDVKLVLCVILAIFIPPLGMYLWNKKTDFWFILDLILFLLLFTWFFWGALGLLGLAAIVIALLRVFDAI